LNGVMYDSSNDQKIMGSFALYDMDHDFQVSRQDLFRVMRLMFAVRNKEFDEEVINRKIDYMVSKVDTNHSGGMELSEIAKACQKDETIFGIFVASFGGK